MRRSCVRNQGGLRSYTRDKTRQERERQRETQSRESIVYVRRVFPSSTVYCCLCWPLLFDRTYIHREEKTMVRVPVFIHKFSVPRLPEGPSTVRLPRQSPCARAQASPTLQLGPIKLLT
jgi:hypothetical protein